MVPLFCCQFRWRYSGKFTHGTSVLWEIGEVIEKISTFRFLFKLPVIVLWTKYFHKTNFKMGVNRLVSKLGGATLPTFHTELFNIAGSW